MPGSIASARFRSASARSNACWLACRPASARWASGRSAFSSCAATSSAVAWCSAAPSFDDSELGGHSGQRRCRFDAHAADGIFEQRREQGRAHTRIGIGEGMHRSSTHQRVRIAQGCADGRDRRRRQAVRHPIDRAGSGDRGLSAGRPPMRRAGAAHRARRRFRQRAPRQTAGVPTVCARTSARPSAPPTSPDDSYGTDCTRSARRASPIDRAAERASCDRGADRRPCRWSPAYGSRRSARPASPRRESGASAVK